MKKIGDFIKDVREEKLDIKESVVFGIVVPVVFILIMGLAGWIES